MRIKERKLELNKTNKTADKYAIIGYLFIAILYLGFGNQLASAQVDCSTVLCDSTDQQTINGYDMFDETNFDPVVDGLGRTRQFYIHIPTSYDTLAADQLMPTIFAFHGGGQDRMAMIDGKWGDDYFDQEIAFVIPRGEPHLCDTNANPKRVWMQSGLRNVDPSGPPLPADCDSATQQVDLNGNPITYWNTSIPNTFLDVVFAENLREVILNRFPKLNPQKVYATGFSSGGGMTNMLLCYRSSKFRGFSIVAKVLYGRSQRGDYEDNGTIQPDSLVATCGKNLFDAGHATGITTPNIWGYGIAYWRFDPTQLPPLQPVYRRITKPVTLFVGNQDDGYTLQEINDTGAEIRSRNNLNGTYYLSNPFMNSQADEAETQRRIFSLLSDPLQPYSVFTRYYVKRVDDPAITPDLLSAGHAMPDEDEPPTVGIERMTSDFNYTDRTVIFFESHADMNLNP